MGRQRVRSNQEIVESKRNPQLVAFIALVGAKQSRDSRKSSKLYTGLTRSGFSPKQSRDSRKDLGGLVELGRELRREAIKR